MRWPPGGAPLIPAILPQPERRQAVLGGLESPARLVLDRRAIDRRQSAGAPEPSQLDRLTSIGFEPGARVRWAESGGHDPAAPVLLGARAVEPGPPGPRFVNQDERFGVRAEGAETLGTVALAGTATPPEDDLWVPRLTGLMQWQARS
jgi:hypothetical protein